MPDPRLDQPSHLIWPLQRFFLLGQHPVNNLSIEFLPPPSLLYPSLYPIGRYRAAGTSVAREAQSQAGAEPLPFVSCPGQASSVPPRMHTATNRWERCTLGQTHSTQPSTQTPWMLVKMCVCSDPGDTRTLRLQTRPPPAGRLPSQVQLSRPKQIPADKDTAFELEPVPRCDQISGPRRKRKSLLFLLLRLLLGCCSTQRGCLEA